MKYCQNVTPKEHFKNCCLEMPWQWTQLLQRPCQSSHSILPISESEKTKRDHSSHFLAEMIRILLSILVLQSLPCDFSGHPSSAKSTPSLPWSNHLGLSSFPNPTTLTCGASVLCSTRPILKFFLELAFLDYSALTEPWLSWGYYFPVAFLGQVWFYLSCSHNSGAVRLVLLLLLLFSDHYDLSFFFPSSPSLPLSVK